MQPSKLCSLRQTGIFTSKVPDSVLIPANPLGAADGFRHRRRIGNPAGTRQGSRFLSEWKSAIFRNSERKPGMDSVFVSLWNRYFLLEKDNSVTRNAICSRLGNHFDTGRGFEFCAESSTFFAHSGKIAYPGIVIHVGCHQRGIVPGNGIAPGNELWRNALNEHIECIFFRHRSDSWTRPHSHDHTGR